MLMGWPSGVGRFKDGEPWTAKGVEIEMLVYVEMGSAAVGISNFRAGLRGGYLRSQ